MYPLFPYISCDYSEGARLYRTPASFYEIQVLCTGRPPAGCAISVPYFVGMPTIKILFKHNPIFDSFRDTMNIEFTEKLLLGDVHFPLEGEEKERDIHLG
jgi:hypothetical protein